MAIALQNKFNNIQALKRNV